MVISSRTPEGQPNWCPICRKAVVMEPSQPFGDVPCPHCGCLLLFEPLDDGYRVSVAAAKSEGAIQVVARSMYACPQCKTRIPYGTETQPAPDRCPTCQRRLYIPTVVENLTLGLAPKATQQVMTRKRRGIRTAVLAFLRRLRLTSRGS